MKGRWFRFYDDVVNDPKVQKMPPELFKAWVNILCLASKNDGRLPSLEDLCFCLRLSPIRARATINCLKDYSLLDEIEGWFVPHNWHGRQYKSDVSTERVKRFRERSKTVSETPAETTPDTETDTETDKKGAKTRRAPKRASQLDPSWKPSEIPEGFSESEITKELPKFRDYWIGHGKAMKDWNATFRNWLRNAREYAAKNGNGAAKISRPIVAPLPVFKSEPPEPPISEEEMARRAEMVRKIKAQTILTASKMRMKRA